MLVPTFVDRGFRMVSPTDPHGRILASLDRNNNNNNNNSDLVYLRANATAQNKTK
jgi:hypothetical protein